MAEADQQRVPVIGIGASAGGIQAFKGFFENMPPDSGYAFVVMLHLPTGRESLLPDLIGRWTTMPVIEAEDGCALRRWFRALTEAGRNMMACHSVRSRQGPSISSRPSRQCLVV